MTSFINRDIALSHPFANGHYDHEHANEHFILGYESYKEWMEYLPATEIVYCGKCKFRKDFPNPDSIYTNCTKYNRSPLKDYDFCSDGEEGEP